MMKKILPINHFNHLCEAYLLGKHARRSFPNEETSKATKSLELVHVNAYGPINPPSLGKTKYLVLFINDFSKKKLEFIFLSKNQKLLLFKKFEDTCKKGEWM